MNTQYIKNEQINNVILLGRTAKREDKMRFPWQDTDLMDILKSHRADIQGNASFNELMAAWLIGWDLQELENLSLNNYKSIK